MTKSSSKRKARIRQKKSKLHDANAQNADEIASQPVYKPKRGPGQVFRRELIGAATGHAKRYRNVAATPLMLAHDRGDLAGPHDYSADAMVRIIDADRFTAGEEFEKIWFVIYRAGSDSSIARTGGGGGLFWTEAKDVASDKLAKIKTRMNPCNYCIIKRFCGEQMSMAQALRGVAEVHPNGVKFRVREALDDLVRAMTGRPAAFEMLLAA